MADRIVRKWNDHRAFDELRGRRYDCLRATSKLKRSHALLEAAIYPEVVTLAGLLASPFWVTRLIAPQTGFDSFAVEMDRRLRIGWHGYSYEPCRLWADRDGYHYPDQLLVDHYLDSQERLASARSGLWDEENLVARQWAPMACQQVDDLFQSKVWRRLPFLLALEFGDPPWWRVPSEPGTG